MLYKLPLILFNLWQILPKFHEYPHPHLPLILLLLPLTTATTLYDLLKPFDTPLEDLLDYFEAELLPQRERVAVGFRENQENLPERDERGRVLGEVLGEEVEEEEDEGGEREGEGGVEKTRKKEGGEVGWGAAAKEKDL